MRRDTTPLNFVRAFGGQWFSAMSGPVSVPLAIWGYFYSGDALKIGLFLLAITCVVISSYIVWKKEREEVIRLEAVIAPKFSLHYRESENCLTKEILNDITKRKAEYVRIIMHLISGIHIDECFAEVVSIDVIDDDDRVARSVDMVHSINLTPNRFTVSKSGLQKIDVLRLVSGFPVLEVFNNNQPRIVEELSSPGRYRFKILVSAPGAISQSITIQVHWKIFRPLGVRQIVI